MATSDANALLLTISADTTKLIKQMEKASGTVTTHTRKMEADLTGLEKFFGKTSIPKALDKVFDSTRFKVLDSGVARVGIFGGALEALGPAGLAAAAGIGAVALAFKGAGDAAKFADDIEDTAKRLHVTTDALQEYRYAVFKAGGTTEGADQALEAFSVTLGKAQEGLKKSKRAFDALGLDPNSFKTVEEALTAVSEKIAQLKNNPQKDAIIQQLGLEGLKPAIENMQALRAEAEKIGVVMDADLIKKGADANKQFETLSKVIDIQLKSALVELAPLLVDLLKIAAAFAHEMADVVQAIRGIQHATRGQLEADQTRIDDFIAKQSGNLSSGNPLTRAFAQQSIKDSFAARQRVTDQLAKLGPAIAEPGIPTGNLGLIGPPGPKGPKTPDHTIEATARIQALLDESRVKLAQAFNSLTDSVEESAKFEHEQLIAEGQKEADRIKAEEEKIKADKGLSDATKTILLKKLDEARLTDLGAAIAKDQLITRQADFAIEDKQIDIHRQIVDALLDQLQAEADSATTAAQRNAIEKRILDVRQQLERDLRGSNLDRQVLTGAITPEQRDKQMAVWA